MSTFESFEDMQAWQEGRVLVGQIRMICKKRDVSRDFAFVDQVTRAARSVCANIAEGFECMTTPEFISFLGIAKRSAGEVRSHLYDAKDELYITSVEFDALAEQTRKVSRIIAGLIHYLQTTDLKQRRTVKQRNQQPVTSNQ